MKSFPQSQLLDNLKRSRFSSSLCPVFLVKNVLSRGFCSFIKVSFLSILDKPVYLKRHFSGSKSSALSLKASKYKRNILRNLAQAVGGAFGTLRNLARALGEAFGTLRCLARA
ncbi:MAG: hypothetical protein ACRCSB_02030, partial [Bacteroidales bacterium]